MSINMQYHWLGRLSTAILVLNFINPVFLQGENLFTNIQTNLFANDTNLNPIVTDQGTCTAECVPYYLCQKDGKIITDGTGIFDIRNKDSCPDVNHFCCGENGETVIDNKNLTPNEQPNFGPIGTCGLQNIPNQEIRISGGKEALFGEYPWMIALMYNKEIFEDGVQKIGKVYHCGGALIHPQVVVTSAHCIHNRIHNTSFFVLAGEWDAQTTTERLPHQTRNVVSSLIHPNYKRGPLFNDIALLFLDSPVELADNVGTICLPPQNLVPESRSCYVSGWGKDKFGKKGVASTILKSIQLPIVDRRTCQSSLRLTRLGKHFQLHESFVCAGGEPGKDSCNKDGGSPLVCPVPGQPGRFYQAGIVAWGIGCGEENTPGVYVNVPIFRDWIDQEMQNKGFQI